MEEEEIKEAAAEAEVEAEGIELSEAGEAPVVAVVMEALADAEVVELEPEHVVVLLVVDRL